MLEKIIKNLKSANLADVSRKTGIHINTLYLIRDSKDTNPRINTVAKIEEYFND